MLKNFSKKPIISMPLKEGQILETEEYNFVLGGPPLFFSKYFIVLLFYNNSTGG